MVKVVVVVIFEREEKKIAEAGRVFSRQVLWSVFPSNTLKPLSDAEILFYLHITVYNFCNDSVKWAN